MLKLGRKKPKQGRSETTVAAIYEAVARILNKDGAVGLTTNKIAEVAGISVGSLYQYFKNKESIFEALLLNVTEQNLKDLERIVSETDPKSMSVSQLVRIIVETQFNTFEKMGKLSLLLLQFAPQVLPVSHFKNADDRIVNFLTQKMKEYQLPLRVKNPEYAFFVCAQAIRASIFMAFNNKKPEEYGIIKEELIDMLSRYLEPDV